MSQQSAQDAEAVSQLAGRAELAWNQGRVAAADVLLRSALGLDPAHAAAQCLRAEMALALGRPDVAWRAARAALDSSPNHPRLRHVLVSAETRLARWPGIPQPGSGERLLLIKSWGFGFWSDVYHVLTSCLLAEYTGRIPMVHWGEGCLFHAGDDTDAWRRFFRPVTDLADEAVFASSQPVFHPRWRGRLAGPLLDRFAADGGRMHALLLMDRPESIVVSDFATPTVALLPWAPEGHWSHGRGPDEVLIRLMTRYAVPSREAEVLAAVVLGSIPDPGRCVALHLRGTDKQIENLYMADIRAECLTRVEWLLTERSVDTVLLLTDDSDIETAMRTRYGKRLIVPDAARVRGAEGLHYRQPVGPTQLGLEVLRDVLAAAACGWFVGTGASNVSTAVVHRWQGLKERAVLISPSIHGFDFSGPQLHGPP